MFQHLLIPLDGSPQAEAALPYALSLAEHYGAQLTLLQVVAPSVEAEMQAELPGIEAQVIDRERRIAAGYLRQKETELAARGLRVAAVTLSHPSIPDAILAAVADVGAEAVVMSTHGLTGLSRLVLGSVAEQVVRRANVPVVLIRSRKEEGP
jgi:nucleotide-binding universal stress UspA family protein